MSDKETARRQIMALVDSYRQLSEAQKRRYSEEDVKKDFLLPLFRALDWDVENAQRRGEVRAEEKIADGYPDYSFRLNGVPVFFLEAKKFSVDINAEKPMKQAINYGYLKGVTWAVLSDFEGLMVFNADWEERDPIKARMLDLHWQHYVNNDFDRLWLLSRESIEAGEIDQRAEEFGKKKKRDDVNKVLFADLTKWRHALFDEITRMGATLWSRDYRKVDEAIQRFLDRLIFIRTVEDRRIEENRLRSALRQYKDSRKKGKNLFNDLLALFRELDEHYNARLFALHPLDTDLEIHDENLLTDLINGLYDVKGGYATYDFAAIDADVLGAVYEQYLSFKAQDPQGKGALDLSKRTKRKAQGIYYTPKYVVRYIVGQTLGKLLEAPDMTPEKAHRLRILDPACGSGSFLIEAFQVLDRWLAEHGDETDRQFPRRRQMRILQENLYGVDLDPQAVEVARLNLLLQAAHERGKLPMLHNIQYGNSLIEDPAVAGEAAFRWAERFPDVMAAGGFDVVIGNPPYIRIQTLPENQVEWFSENYKASTGNYDIYVLFVERTLQIQKCFGFSGFILPSKFFTTDYGLGLRTLLAQTKTISKIVDFGHAQVFEDATTYTTLLFLQGNGVATPIYSSAQNWLLNARLKPNSLDEAGLTQINITSLSSKPWTFSSQDSQNLLNKIRARSTNLIELTTGIARGSSTGADSVFVLKANGNTFISSNGKQVNIETDCLRTPLYATDFSRYSFYPAANERIIFPYYVEGLNYKLIPENVFAKQFPNAYQYLQEHRAELESRKQWASWHGYSAPRSLAVHDHADFLVPLLANRGSFCKFQGTRQQYCLMASGGFSISISDDKDLNPLYLLGVLNSTLLFWNLSIISNVFRGGWITCTKQYTGQLPIRTINFDDPADKQRHDDMVTMVERMLKLKADHAQAEAAHDERRFELAQQIERLDKQIDTLVYDLYGLTEAEIALVEGGQAD